MWSGPTAVGPGPLATFADIMANASQVGSSVVIEIGADQSVELAGLNLGQLSSGDFLIA